MWRRCLSSWFGATICSFALLAVSLAVLSSVSLLGSGVAQAADEEAKLDDLAAKDQSAAPENEYTRMRKSESWLHWLYRSLTPIYSLVFFAISFTLVAYMVMNVLAVRRQNICPPELVQSFEAFLEEKKYQEAYEMAKNDESFLGQVLSAGMGKLAVSYDEATGAMQEVGDSEAMKLEHRLGIIALMAQIGPMFGLLGTVDGMVQAFETIASKDQTPRPSDLAQGIGTALVTTVVGLWVAIPAILFYSIVRIILARRLFEVGNVSEALMKRFKK
jgi:biopolymer transport protein ExbB